MACIEVGGEMSRQGSSIIGDPDEAILLSPAEALGVRRAKRKLILQFAAEFVLTH